MWAADITYVPVGQGFLYLVAIEPCGASLVPVEHDGDIVLCVCARRGLGAVRPAWDLQYQGSQFTSAAFSGTLAATGVRISMAGGGRWMENVFIERLWRSLKHEDIYLKDYSDGHEAKAEIARGIAFYNFQRPHQELENRAPMAVWRTGRHRHIQRRGSGYDAARSAASSSSVASA
ncbi:integrase core domain-containing protein [Bradyrhizobium sp. WSM3983]|uniref:integrase core domain-containing protein n=1 Tax=Bradyrhizobium sp. WSM3983 TaxID=1038867 RepID=UPI0009FC1DEB|nr:integrase core domain-containing protein [Bradyrhizobium sp. WSM3983]